jgi:HK97 family phage prohead protease
MGAKSRLDFGDSSPENSLMHAASVAEDAPDFSGWATKFGLRCTDGRVILPGAFSHQDSQRVPLVWQHGHASPENVLGHAILEDRKEGTYCYGYFNETAQAKNAKTLVKHEDISALSIFANSLVEKAKQVSHGIIREVSLVLAGANPGALIDNIEIAHADGEVDIVADEAIIYTGLELEHSDGPSATTETTETTETETTETEVEHTDGETVQDVYESMSPEQQEVVHYMVGAALESKTAAHADTDGETTETGASDKEDVTHEDKDENEMSGRNVFETARGTPRRPDDAVARRHARHRRGRRQARLAEGGRGGLRLQARHREHRHAVPGRADHHRHARVRLTALRVGLRGPRQGPQEPVLADQVDHGGHHPPRGAGQGLHQGHAEEGGVLRPDEARHDAEHDLQEAEARP